MRKPKYELLDALTTAAAETTDILDKKYGEKDNFNPDIVLWETMLVNRINNPGGFMVAIINELGYDRYLEIRDKVAREEKDLTKAA